MAVGCLKISEIENPRRMLGLHSTGRRACRLSALL